MRNILLLNLIILTLSISFAQDETIFIDYANPVLPKTMSVKEDNVKIEFKNFNSDRVKIKLSSKDRSYIGHQPIKIEDLSNGISKSKKNQGDKKPPCSSYKGDVLNFGEFISQYVIHDTEASNLLDQLEVSYPTCDEYKEQYLEMIAKVYKLQSTNTQVYHLNLNKGDAKDVYITFARYDATGNFIDSTYHEFTLYKVHYFSSSVSLGIFYSAGKEHNYAWESINTNDTIFQLDSSAYYKIQSKKNRTKGIGANALTHLSYHFSPEFLMGVHLGLGTVLSEGSDKVFPQLQYGITFGFLKEKRILINIGGNLARVSQTLSPYINPNVVYRHDAVGQLDLNENTEKSYKSTGLTISVTYQIL
ncbi:MAG: hypothetical protein R2774_01350 [Saprospiraceae bacterium]